MSKTMVLLIEWPDPINRIILLRPFSTGFGSLKTLRKRVRAKKFNHSFITTIHSQPNTLK